MRNIMENGIRLIDILRILDEELEVSIVMDLFI